MSETALHIALAQMEVVAGQPTKNFETIASFVERAKAAGADVVAFPELCLSGRYLGDRWHDDAFVSYCADFDRKMLALSEGIGIVYGNCTPLDSGAIRYAAEPEAYLSDVRVCANGEWIQPMRECDCDDDCDCDGDCECDGDCGCGCDSSAFPLFPIDVNDKDCVIAVGIGDLSGTMDRISGTMDLVACDVTYKCDAIIDICATPWKAHRLILAEDAPFDIEEDDISLPPILRVNCVGMQNTDKAVFSFDGGSCVFIDGVAAAWCRDDFQEDLLVVSVDLATGAVNYDDASRPAYDEDDKTLDAIVWALRRFDAQVFPFHPKWIIGLSGGLDSSVTAALMYLAFGGPERIVGYNLATRYNSDATKMNAYDLSQALGIRLVNGSIEPVVQATADVAGLYGYEPQQLEGLVQENIQARVRGHLLSTFAAIEGGVVMNNGNKVEATLGYATLYGDAIGAIAPLGDVTKVRLFRLARCINERLGMQAIPENLIPEETEEGYVWETMPSAELKDAQKDPMKWFYHDWIVENLVDSPDFSIEGLMEMYLNDRLAQSPVAKWVRFYGLDNPQAFIDDLEWLMKQMGVSVFKRIQMPPSILVVRDTVSYDFRENQAKFEQTDRYRTLKEQILALA